MRILITGISGFVGSTLAHGLKQADASVELFGLDNFIRPGSETNRASLKRIGAKLFHGDIRVASDLEQVPAVDFLIDAAANPSVLAGVDGKTSSRQLIEHNLTGTINLLEFCKQHRAGFILLSTSRVYSIAALSTLPVVAEQSAFRLNLSAPSKLPSGVSDHGVDETFSTQAPVSLYGATKLASEAIALEYGETFNLPVFINRCGVLAGAGQFGRADQGIFAYWLNCHLRRRPLQYIGFDGLGHQVRDSLHPRDLVVLLKQQMLSSKRTVEERTINCSGGITSARSLRQLTAWCDEKFGPHAVTTNSTPRPFDLPWVVLDSAKARRIWGWQPTTSTDAMLDEIARHAEDNPNWLDLSAPF
jgi:CDP-paratose 2-epimerase